MEKYPTTPSFPLIPSSPGCPSLVPSPHTPGRPFSTGSLCFPPFKLTLSHRAAPARCHRDRQSLGTNPPQHPAPRERHRTRAGRAAVDKPGWKLKSALLLGLQGKGPCEARHRVAFRPAFLPCVGGETRVGAASSSRRPRSRASGGGGRAAARRQVGLWDRAAPCRPPRPRTGGARCPAG